MNHYIVEHEAYIRSLLDSEADQDWERIKKYHRVQIKFMQHERLVHMLVTLAFGFFLALAIVLAFIFNLIFLVFLVLFFGVMEVFYLVHLFRLETGVQRWYRLYNELTRRSDEQKEGRE